MKKVVATPSQAHARRNEILKFVREHGPVDLTQVCAHFGWPRSSTGEWLSDMAATSHIEIIKTKTGSRSLKNVYQHGDNANPILPARDYAPKEESTALPWEKNNRRVVPEKQIGMVRDSMIAALFGPAVVV